MEKSSKKDKGIIIKEAFMSLEDKTRKTNVQTVIDLYLQFALKP